MGTLGVTDVVTEPKGREMSMTPKPRAVAKPHFLGGSNNLVNERNRREKAESALQEAQRNLKLLKNELGPHVLELSQAVRTMQVEKHLQLDLDEASQDVLEALQAQMNALEATQTGFPTLIHQHMEDVQTILHEQNTTEHYAMKVLVSQMQDVQDELIAEIRLLRHEMTASEAFLSKRISLLDDAAENIRSELTRAADRQQQIHQGRREAMSQMDEKLFALDKELLKLKLAMPSSMAAQLPTPGGPAEFCRPGLALDKKLHEMCLDIDALKADTLAQKQADRKQFDAVTNRIRETQKKHQSLKEDMDTQLQEQRVICEQLITKVPSELSKRFMAAQSLWESELQTLKAVVHRLQTNPSKPVSTPPDKRSTIKETQCCDEEKQNRIMNTLQTDLNDLRAELHLALGKQTNVANALSSSVNRIDQDLLALYDWTREKLIELKYFLSVSHSSNPSSKWIAKESSCDISS